LRVPGAFDHFETAIMMLLNQYMRTDKAFYAIGELKEPTQSGVSTGVAGRNPRSFSTSCACEVTPTLCIADINELDAFEVERPNR
jgi:hypothetical protein